MDIIPQVYAASNLESFGRVIDPIITHIVNPIVMLMFAVGLVVFAYGVIEMITHQSDENARAKGKSHMLGGVIGMFIMLSAWGIINLIANTVKGIEEGSDRGIQNVDAPQNFGNQFQGQV